MGKVTYENRRRYKLKEKYGITPEDYDKLYVEQGGRCKICGIHQSEILYNNPSQYTHNSVRMLVVDHNHDTGKVRGLLCRVCNIGLGQFKDNKDLLITAIKYLEGE